MKRAAKFLGVLLVGVFVGIQFVPQARTNPPVSREVHWDSPDTRALAQRACFDCHSNVTAWPWYSHVAPASFLVVDHVVDGRRHLNFSEWDKPQRGTMKDIEELVHSGEMPIWNYVLLHPEAKLTPEEAGQLIEGLRKTYEQDPPTRPQRRAPAAGGTK